MSLSNNRAGRVREVAWIEVKLYRKLARVVIFPWWDWPPPPTPTPTSKGHYAHCVFQPAPRFARFPSGWLWVLLAILELDVTQINGFYNMASGVGPKAMRMKNEWRRHRFTRLPFSIESAPEILQREMDRPFKGIPVEIIAGDLRLCAIIKETLTRNWSTFLTGSRIGCCKFNPKNSKLELRKWAMLVTPFQLKGWRQILSYQRNVTTKAAVTLELKKRAKETANSSDRGYMKVK